MAKLLKKQERSKVVDKVVDKMFYKAKKVR